MSFSVSSLPETTALWLSVTGDFAATCFHSAAMILVTEIGDKTFFIAAVLAMRHARITVYSGAMGEKTAALSHPMH